MIAGFCNSVPKASFVQNNDVTTLIHCANDTSGHRYYIYLLIMGILLEFATG